jgi:disulfide bond formation protein DsbB
MAIVSLYSPKEWELDLVLIAILAFSTTILAFSFYHQHIEKVEPCTLCKWQRFVYLTIFSLSLLGLKTSFNFHARNALSILFLISLCLAVYHTFVQFGWLADQCVMEKKVENIDNFLAMLETQKIPCSNISWKLLNFAKIKRLLCQTKYQTLCK